MASENLAAILATTSAAPWLERVPSALTAPGPAPVPGHTPPSAATHHGYGHGQGQGQGHGHGHGHDNGHSHGYSLSQGQASTSTSTSTTLTATSLPYDPSLDPTIRALLDQQAEIEARLAALLPRKYGPNVKVELDMLRHKLRILRAFAGDNRKQRLTSSSIYITLPLAIFSSLPGVWKRRLWLCEYCSRQPALIFIPHWRPFPLSDHVLP